MLDPAQPVRSANHLQAAVAPVGAVDGDVAARHVWEKAAVVVPVAVILVPLPGAADPGLLHHHLVVVEIDLVAHQPLDRIHDPAAVAEPVVDILALRVGSEPELGRASFRVCYGMDLRVLLLVGPADLQQQLHLLGIEQAGDHQVPILLELRDLVVGDLEAVHDPLFPFMFGTLSALLPSVARPAGGGGVSEEQR